MTMRGVEVPPIRDATPMASARPRNLKTGYFPKGAETGRAYRLKATNVVEVERRGKQTPAPRRSLVTCGKVDSAPSHRDLRRGNEGEAPNE